MGLRVTLINALLLVASIVVGVVLLLQNPLLNYLRQALVAIHCG